MNHDAQRIFGTRKFSSLLLLQQQYVLEETQLLGFRQGHPKKHAVIGAYGVQYAHPLGMGGMTTSFA